MSTPIQLDEKITFKQFVIASIMGTAGLSIGSMNREPTKTDHIKIIELPKPVTIDNDKLVDTIVDKYKVDANLASQIVDLAKKHARPTFPKTEDILTIIGIESSFNPLAKSKLKNDPAKGLMQVRAGVWKLPDSELHKVEDQIKHGANILAHYHEKLKDEDAAITAYNIGITKYKKNNDDPRGKVYLSKFNKERGLYEGELV